MSKSIRKSASLTDSEFSAQAPIALGRRFYQIAVAAVAEVHAPIGLTPLEFAVLIHLHDAPGIDQNTLAERMALDRTSTGALVYRLERQRFLKRDVNGEDRRARVLRLTAARTGFARKAASQGTCRAGATTGRAGASGGTIAGRSVAAGDRRESDVCTTGRWEASAA